MCKNGMNSVLRKGEWLSVATSAGFLDIRSHLPNTVGKVPWWSFFSFASEDSAMAVLSRGKPVRIIFATVVLTLAGCGDGRKAMVTGKVTYEGQAVESGFITFFPEDKQGTSAEGEIINGEYTIPNLTPGKKRVFISITEQVEPTTTNVTKSREEANAER